MAMRHHVHLAILLTLPLLLPVAARADNVIAGDDLFRTDQASSYQDFSGTPLPPSFFDPGSDPFVGTVQFKGLPLGVHPACPLDDLSQVDTIVRRQAGASLPVIPSSDTVPIEIIALQLVSANPITVTYNGGLNPEAWNVRVTLSQSAPQVPGTMTINHLNPQGGTFSSILPVKPLFTFTRISDNAVRVLDLGDFGGAIQFQAQNVPWIHVVPTSGSCASNFCVNPGQLTTEQALLAAHGVLSICPQHPTPARTPTWGLIKVSYR